MPLLADIVDLALRVFALGLFVAVILNWLDVAVAASVRGALNRFYDIFLDPIRRFIRPVKFFSSAPAGLDMTPLILLLLIWWLVHPFLMWVIGGGER